jgi:hypothetical protein
VSMFDKITEEIAHFIGVFHISIEDARVREAYQEFSFNSPQSDLNTPPVPETGFAAPFQLLDYDPDLNYRSPWPDLRHLFPRMPEFRTIPHPQNAEETIPRNLSSLWPQEGIHVTSHGAIRFIQPELEPPGSVVNYINQAIGLSDDDDFGVGGHSLVFSPGHIDNSKLLEGAQVAASLSPIAALVQPGSSSEIIAVVKATMSDVGVPEPRTNDATQVFSHAETIEGVYVNGQQVIDTPKLEDHHSWDDVEKTEDGPSSNVSIMEDGSISIEVAVKLEAGGNTLVNDAVLKSLWTGGTVTAVAGDHVESNVITQINALWDIDTITSAFGNSATVDANELFNIATFERIDASDPPDTGSVDAGIYPRFWSITQIDGDLMIVNWLKQFIFMSDNDVGVLSSSGATTSVVSGNNLGINHTSIFNLGFSYDLVLVGGSVYDANIIQQMNVLFDNDTVWGAPGFQTTGQGTLSSSDNLLWNQAHILNIGNADRFDTLPQAYLETTNSLANGGKDFSHDILSDDAFAGLSGLHVLYITGDLLKLQSIEQVNILGDSDQIALAMNAITPHLDAEWTITTGSNALVNNAVIIDLDSFGKTYVGGEQYSQETLYQAELISHQPDFGVPNPDMLVNEAVLFLDDSMLDAPDAASEHYIAAEYDAHPGDGVNSVLGH